MKKSTFLALFLAALLMNVSLDAVPSYTRNLGIDCTVCHTAYPQLTEFGKVFLETAGDLLIQEDYGMVSMSPYPLSGRLNLRPIDKRFSKDLTTSLKRADRKLKLRALHEVEFFLSGRVGKVFYFTVFEAEDEWGDEGRPGFDVRMVEGYAVYRMCENLNIVLGYASPFVLDGNDTVHHHKVLRRQWKAEEYVPHTSQFIGVNGIRGNFNWIVAWHGDFEELEGQDPKSFSLRGSYDCCNNTFGAYFTRGQHFNEELCRSNELFYFYGVDAHLRYGNTNIMMLLGFRDEYGEKTDFDFSIEANAICDIKNKCINRYLTTFIPIINLDVFVDRKKSNGTWLQGSGGVAFYLNPAVRIMPILEGSIITPSEYKHHEIRLLLIADIGI